MRKLLQYINERTSATNPLLWFMVTAEFQHLVLDTAWFRKPCSYPYEKITIQHKPCYLFTKQHGTLTGYNPNPRANKHDVSAFYLFFLANNLEVHGHVSGALLNELYLYDNNLNDRIKLFSFAQAHNLTHPAQNDGSWSHQAALHRKSVLEKRLQTQPRTHRSTFSDPQLSSPCPT